jgi:prepilin-type N-terminal cleavage/methylation domain-containing protein
MRKKSFTKRADTSAGFTILELVVAVAVILILSVIAIPGAMATLRAYRLAGSARSVAHQVSLARLRAETDFTNAQLVIDPATNTYSLQVCTSGGKVDTCTTAGDYNNEGTQFLSTGISFGFGAAATAAAGQTPMSQTLQTRFNSRGIPILLDGTGNTNPNDVIYLADTQGNAYAVGVTVGGHVHVYQYTGSAWKQL